MRYINPPEIASSIMTMMDYAKEKVVIISPYNKVSGWQKLEKHIKRLIDNNLSIEWYIRSGQDEESKKQISKYGLNPIEIENLHAKIYFNEKYAIITSMNLHYYSDINSLDFAYMTETENEYKEIIQFYETYIKKIANKNSIISIDENRDVLDICIDAVSATAITGKNKIERKSMSKDDEVVCKDFMVKGLYLYFVNKRSYFRIIYDFDRPFSYKDKTALYNLFADRQDYYDKKLGHSISWGSQMKRIKIDLMEIKSNENGVTSKENIKRIFDTYKKSTEIFIPEIVEYIKKFDIKIPEANDIISVSDIKVNI